MEKAFISYYARGEALTDIGKAVKKIIHYFKGKGKNR